jgi:hypothetical protein
MKKTLNQTIIVFIVLSLITSTQSLAQDVVEEENQEVLETQAKEADLAQRKAEIAAEVAKREEEITASLQNQLEDTQQQMEALLGEVEAKQKQIYLGLPRLPKVPFSHLQQSGGGILVIPSAQMKVEDLAAITEDLNVMSRIFDEKLSQSDMLTARGRMLVDLNPYFRRGNRTPEAIYLEGYGALFLLKVNMLLSAPPAPQQQDEKIQKDTDPVWAETRRQMYEPEEVGRSRTKDQPEEKYDAEKVETLKTNLIKTLKHATNIRALKSDQLVILTIIGEGNRSDSNFTQKFFSYGRSTGSRYVVPTVPEVEAESLVPTVLTICAKKSDIDAFAKGELDYEQFRKRTEIFKSYAKAGQQASPAIGEYKVAREAQAGF